MLGFEVLDEGIDSHIIDCLRVSVRELVSSFMDIFQKISNCLKSLRTKVIEIVRPEE
jgi:hypothetical protein